MKSKSKHPASARLNWDTVELVAPIEAPLAPTWPPPAAIERVFPDRRGRSVLKKLLSGAAMKARGRGAIYTHTQLRRSLGGWQRFLYGWALLAAALESERHFAYGVELAARAIEEASAQLAGLQ